MLSSVIILSHFLRYKKWYIRLFWCVEAVLFILVIFSLILPDQYLSWNSYGRLAGKCAVVSFILSIFPGILKRFSVSGALQKLQVILITYRRQFGIAMYLFALYHFLWLRLMPSLKYHGNLLPQTVYEIIGFTAFLLTTPLFLTSNDFAQNHLGRYWRLLHRLVYIIVWVIFLHLSLLGRVGWSLVLIYAVALLEVFSWLVVWYQRQRPVTQTIVTQG